MRILVVEDDPSLREVMRAALEADGACVDEARGYADGRDKAARGGYDCVVLDIGLGPGPDGLQLLADLRRDGRPCRVLIVSARDSVDDKVLGLELGADDYLAKPFHLAELRARARSVARRGLPSGATQIGNLRLDPASNTATVDGRPLELGRKENDILQYLAARGGSVVAKETLAEAIWGESSDLAPSFDFVYAQIKNLRKKLRDAGATAELKSIYGFGYKLVESD